MSKEFSHRAHPNSNSLSNKPIPILSPSINDPQSNSYPSTSPTHHHHHLISGPYAPFCDSPTTQIIFSPQQLSSNISDHPFRLSRPPTRTLTSTSSIPSLSVTYDHLDSPPSVDLDLSGGLLLYDEPCAQFSSPPASSIPFSTTSPRSTCPSLPSTPAQNNSKPPSLLSSPFIHRRHASQPSTPVPVKETLNGSISDHGLEDGQRKLNQYLLLKTIGRGSFGSVELAQDLSSPQQHYAIKEYSKSRMRKRARLLNNRSPGQSRARRLPPCPSHEPPASPSAGMDLVKAEVAIMKKLSHPNIVSLVEVIDTDSDSLFFVLELCPFGPVMSLPSPPLKEAEARNIFRQLILGIEYLHYNQIIHRDIKPDNILFSEDPKLEHEPVCKIVDFGVSENFSQTGDDTTQKSAGSPAFLSPELCASAGGTQGKAADIWAMGVTLYTLVLGHLPFEDTNQLALCERIINGPLSLPDHLDPSLSDLLTKLLAKSPTDRITIFDLKLHPWVTAHSLNPLPSTSENVTPVDPPTEMEIAQAFKSLRSLTTVVKAVTRLKARYQSRRSRSQNDSSIEDDLAARLNLS